MPRTERAYLQIVAWINSYNGVAFSTGDIFEATRISLPQIRTVLHTLRYLGYLSRVRSAYKFRIWATTDSWKVHASRIEINYETFKRVSYGKKLIRKSLAIRGANGPTTPEPKGRA